MKLEGSFRSPIILRTLNQNNLVQDYEDDDINLHVDQLETQNLEPTHFDAFEISLMNNAYDCSLQKFLPVFPVEGMFVRIRLLSTWGDQNYIGLNGLEIYDQEFQPLLEGNTSSSSFKLEADPPSVPYYPLTPKINVLKEGSSDSRTPDKLYNGYNTGSKNGRYWLAPFVYPKSKSKVKALKDCKMNQIMVFFSRKRQLSFINFWNYSKTPERGVKDVEIFIDEKMVFKVSILPPTITTCLSYSILGPSRQT